MLKKGGFFGGFAAVFFLSLIAFFVIFIFMPDVSMKFFNFSSSNEYVEPIKEDIADIKENIVKTDGEAISELNEFLNSDDGREVTEAIQSAAKRAGTTANEYLKSENGKKLVDSAKSYIKSGVGSAKDFFQSEGKEFIEGLKN